MNKYKIFLDYFNKLQENSSLNPPDEVLDVLRILENESLLVDKQKSPVTETGLEILKYLQSIEVKALPACEIAKGMNVSSRKITGAIRKLVSDDFIMKFGQGPIKYILTEQGKNFNIDIDIEE